MSILVTGGAGYIGSHTCVELLNKGEDVIILDNLSNSDISVLDKIKTITNKSFKFYQVDLLDRVCLEKIFEDNIIDSVIHFAGKKAVGESVVKPIEYYINNITGSLILFDTMKKYNCKKIVFSSSATVYGKDAISPLTEDMKIGNTTNPYGTTKFMIEQILQDIYVSDNDFRICILRYFNPIGAHETGLIGDNPNGIPNNLMPYISRVATNKLDKLSVYGNDYDTKDGTGVRDYIHVVDLAKGHIKAIEKINIDTGIHIYNLGTGIGYSVLDIINTYEKVNNIKINYKIVDRRKGDIATCFASPSKAYKELGFKTTKSLEDMCKDTFNFESNINS